MGSTPAIRFLVGVLVVLPWRISPASAIITGNPITDITISPSTFADTDTVTRAIPLSLDEFSCTVPSNQAALFNNDEVIKLWVTHVWDRTTNFVDCTRDLSAASTDAVYKCLGLIISSVGAYEVKCTGTISGSPTAETNSSLIIFSVYNIPTLQFFDCHDVQFSPDDVSCWCIITNELEDDRVMSMTMGGTGANDFVGQSSPASITFSFNGMNPVTVFCEGNVYASNFQAARISKQVEYVYGPTSISVEAEINTPPLKFEHGSVTIKCIIPEDSFHPDFTTEMVMTSPGGGNDPLYSYSITTGGFIVVRYSYTFHVAGIHSPECTARNTMRNSLAMAATGEFTVFGDNIVEIQDCPAVNEQGQSVPIDGDLDDVFYCTCNLTSQGYPASPAVWMDGQGNVLVTDPNAAVLVLYNNGTNGLNYTCAANLTLEDTYVNMTATFRWQPQTTGSDNAFESTVTTIDYKEKENPSDDDDVNDWSEEGKNIFIGFAIGMMVTVVLTALLCLVFKVEVRGWLKECQLLQQQVQPQQHQLQQQQQRLQEEQSQQPRPPQQPQRSPNHYKETGLNRYNGLNILDTREQDNVYEQIVSQDARERQTPITGTIENDLTAQGGGTIMEQDFPSDHNNKNNVGQGPHYRNVIEQDISYTNQDIVIDTNAAMDDSHVYLEVIG